MTRYLGRFWKNGRRLDIDGVTYSLPGTFVPPMPNLEYIAAEGTAANQYNGQGKVADTAENLHFTVPIIIMVDGSAADRARQELGAFLALGSTRRKPMYFSFRADNGIPVEPLYGQFGAFFRLEIVHAYAPENVSLFGLEHGRGGQLDVRLVCRPFPEGTAQVLGTASGAVREDKVGSVTRFSKGLLIPDPVTNLHTNPIFAYQGSAENGWTAEAGIVYQENTNREFVLFGKSSARLTAITSADRAFYQTLTLVNEVHHLGCYAKLPNGGPVTAGYIQIYYEGTAVVTTFQEVGDGWYRLLFAGITTGGSITVGVQVVQGTTIYVDGFMCVESGSFLPEPVFGGLLGTTSAATIHDSAVTQAGGVLRFRFREVLSLDEGTIQLAWNARDTGQLLRYFFADDNGNIRAYINAAEQLRFSDGTNEAGALADAIDDYETVVLHFVFSKDQGLSIYRNGEVVAVAIAYTAPVMPEYLYLGSDESAANRANGAFLYFGTYNIALTGVQAWDDYLALAPLVAAGRAVLPIPFLWTKDGDDVADNADDSSRDNWAVAGGIPGTHPAVTRIDGKISPGWTGSGLFLSNFITNEIIMPGDVLYGEQQGTAGTAAESGGQYNQQAVGAGSAVAWSTTLSDDELEALFEKEVYLFTRLADAGANLTIAFQMKANGTILTDYRRISTAATFRLFKTPPLSITFLAAGFLDDTPGYNAPAFSLSAIRSSGGAANVQVDYTILMPRPLLFLYAGATAGGSPEGFSYSSRIHDAISLTNGNAQIGWLQKQGDRIELVPLRYNNLVSLIGNLAAATTITHTLTYNRIYVTPRWSVV